MSRDDDSLSAGGSSAALGPLDKTFRDTNIVILVLFSVCCSLIAVILGLIGMFTAKDPVAKKNATLVAAIGGILVAISLILQFTGVLPGLQPKQ